MTQLQLLPDSRSLGPYRRNLGRGRSRGRTAERALCPCTNSVTMQTDSGAETHRLASQSRGAQRRRRLKRAVECFILDRRLSTERTRRVAEITLTFRREEVEQAPGAIRTFWNRVRRHYLGTIYFCWLELQRDGTVHYQALWVNPPHHNQVDLLAWVQRWWGHGRTRVRFKQKNWRDDQMLDYALKYANKMGGKAYQQLYDAAPSTLRTVMYGGIEIPMAELKKHLSHDVYRYVPAHESRDFHAPGWSFIQDPYLELVGRVVHDIKHLASCSAPLKRRRRTRRARAPVQRQPGIGPARRKARPRSRR